jgi:beta-glucanase (GH16 family)
MPLDVASPTRRFRRVLLPIAAVAVGLLACMPAQDAIAGHGSTTLCGGGKPPAKPDGGTWVCTFDDEFNGSQVDGTKWYAQTTATSGFGGAECFVAGPNNISESGGVLRLTVRKETAPFTCTTPTGSYSTQYTSGTVNTLGRFSQAYGRFDVRAAFPAATVAGLQSSLWLWPTTNKYGTWPTNGEIDIAEAYSKYPDRVIPFIHYAPASPDPNVTDNYCLIDPGQFHTYTAIWTTSSITIQFDGRTCLSDSWNPAAPLVKPQPFDQPFMIALTQALGVNSNAVTDATPLPATTQIDYVRVWS